MICRNLLYPARDLNQGDVTPAHAFFLAFFLRLPYVTYPLFRLNLNKGPSLDNIP